MRLKTTGDGTPESRARQPDIAMDFEPWWLIIFPIVFALGWVSARIDIKHLVSESRALPRSYFRGLNFLLNEQPDKAIDAFIEVVKVDPDTIELHFALGNLFRRRGETDRAIRMHRSLLERPGLTEAQRLHALAEVGTDYLKAGLLDRAEEAFGKLVGTDYAIEARTSLLEIYQLEKEWQKAIDTARELGEASGRPLAKEIANFHCELAASALSRGKLEEAEAQLAAALRENRRCVRANLLAGDLAVKQGDATGAIERWREVEQQNPQYLALVAHRLLEAYRALGRLPEGLAVLQGYLASHPSLDLLDATYAAALDVEGPESAYRIVRDELRRNPTLTGLDRMLEANILTAPAQSRQDLELVKGLVHGQTRQLARYRCENCGFRARQFYWQCPACNQWETFPPRRTEELDLAP
jgi:lipopolysaccharide biosynthesis regulator YciM